MSTFAIVGSRNFGNDDLVRQTIAQYVTTDDTIISGGAAGVDTLADEMSIKLQCPFIRIPAQWNKYGKSAGHRRNPDIIAESSRVIAFWDGKSKGTKGSIGIAHASRKAILVVYPDGTKKFNEDWRDLYE